MRKAKLKIDKILLKGLYEDFVEYILKKIRKRGSKVNIVLGKSGNGLSIVAKLLEKSLRRKKEDVILLDAMLDWQNIAEWEFDLEDIVIVDNVHSTADLKEVISKVRKCRVIIMYSGNDLDVIKKNFSRSIIAELSISKSDLRDAARQITRSLSGDVVEVKKRRKLFTVIMNILSYNIEIGFIDTVRGLINFAEKIRDTVSVDDLGENGQISRALCIILDKMKREIVSLASEDIKVLIKKIETKDDSIFVKIEGCKEPLTLPITSRKGGLRAKENVLVIKYKLDLSSSVLDCIDLMKYTLMRRRTSIIFPISSEIRKVLENIKIHSLEKILGMMHHLIESITAFLKVVCLLYTLREARENMALELSAIFAYILCLFSWAKVPSEHLDKVFSFFSEALLRVIGIKENKLLANIAKSIIERLLRENMIKIDNTLTIKSQFEDIVESIYSEIKFRTEMIL